MPYLTEPMGSLAEPALRNREIPRFARNDNREWNDSINTTTPSIRWKEPTATVELHGQVFHLTPTELKDEIRHYRAILAKMRYLFYKMARGRPPSSPEDMEKLRTDAISLYDIIQILEAAYRRLTEVDISGLGN